MVTSGLSGNEVYCLNKLGLAPGEVVLGNSVFSLGFMGSIVSSFKNVLGGEISQISSFISEGRELAIQRLENEAKSKNAKGVTGVSSELIHHMERNQIEFLSVGSGIHSSKDAKDQFEYSTSIDAEEMFCNVDAGYNPKRFVFGNVAYALGAVGGLSGMLKTLTRGEVTDYSNILNHTRHIALQRIVDEAKKFGANSVLNIETKIMPYSQGITEMLMIGTAFHNPALGQNYLADPVTSDLTASELWSITALGMMPLKLVLGTSVYSLGVAGGIASAFQSLARGEINTLTTLIYEARERAIGLINNEARAIGADDILGTKIYMYEMGNGLIELMAIGTAVKKVDGLSTKSAELIPQAIIQDTDTFFNYTRYSFGANRR